MAAKSSPTIGIDLGTTHCCVAVWLEGRAEVIANDQGNRTTPSYVAFTDDERLIGEAAKNQAHTNPRNTIFDAKRLIGRKYADSSVQMDMKLWPFQVTCGTRGEAAILVSYRGAETKFTPEEISSMLLIKMKEVAEDYLGQSVKDAVVTVPAYFNDAQRQATKDAGAIAGLDVKRIINEPSAAAFAYGLHKHIGKQINVLVFDLGGGTFDVAVVNISKDSKFEVEAVGGDTHLGGEDFDNRMVEHFIKVIQRRHHKDISCNEKAKRKLRTQCEKAKRMLSNSAQTLMEVELGDMDYSFNVTRALFEELCSDLFLKCMTIVEACLKDAKVDKKAIDQIVLVGGSSRIPKIQELLKVLFDGKELCKNMNPDEAVAQGAAAYAAMMTGSENIRQMVLQDVTPLSLGVKRGADEMHVIIPRNTAIPVVQVSEGWVTSRDNQIYAGVEVYEGERRFVRDNNKLGEFNHKIPPAPEAAIQIVITFEIDENGILHILATDDSSSGSMSRIELSNSGKLSTEEIAKMVHEAEKYKVEDEKAKSASEARNALQESIFAVKEFTEGLAAGEKAVDKEALKRISEWLDTNDKRGNLEELYAMLRNLEATCKPLKPLVDKKSKKVKQGSSVVRTLTTKVLSMLGLSVLGSIVPLGMQSATDS